MSLDRSQMAATADDLRANLERAGLTPDELASWLGLPTEEVAGVIAMDGEASPVEVWLVRDAIEETLRADGDGGDWSVLTDANRDRALGWYPLRDVPTR